MAVPEEISSVENSTGIVVGQLKAICTWHRFVDIITFLLESSCDHSEVLRCKATGKRVIMAHQISPVLRLTMCRWVTIKKIGSRGEEEVYQEIYISWSN